MNSTGANPRRRLILERLTPTGPPRKGMYVSDGAAINLKQDGIATVFIISSEIADLDAYLELLNHYRKEGFRVRNIHLDNLEDTAIPAVKDIVEEISAAFDRESCLILSYGRSLAPMVVACYHVYSGASPSRAISRLRKIDEAHIRNTDEIAFIYKFKRFLDTVQGVNEDDFILQPIIVGDYPGTAAPAPPGKPGIIISRPARDDAMKAAPPSTERGQGTGQAEADDKKASPMQADSRPAGLPADDKVSGVPLVNRSGLPVPHISPAAGMSIDLDVLENEFMKLSGTAPGPVETEAVPENQSVPRQDIPPLPPAGKKHPAKPVRVNEQVNNKKPAHAALPVFLRPKLGVYSIRFKLVSIISAVIVIALSGMIFLATYFFKQDNELRAWESNQKFAEVTSMKVKSDFLAIIERARIIPGIIGKISAEERAALWENDEDFLFIGIAAQTGAAGRPRFVTTLYNQSLMGKSGVTAADIMKSNDLFGKVFSSSFNGEIAVHNVSQGFRMPVTGFSLPLSRDARGVSDRILVCYIRLDRLLKAFRTSGIINVFMVNDRGDIIAHPDGSMIISGGNYINLPIVRFMMKSPLDNGQLRYEDDKGVAMLGSFKKTGIGGCGVIATVDESRAYEQVYRIQRWNLYLLVIVLTISILVIYVFGTTIATPIKRLVSATMKIKEGHYGVDILPTTRDEIGLLTGSFIEMSQGLEEREKMKEAFGKFVNKDIAERVLRGEIALGGERKEVAIFFSDIRNFTAMSEKLQPEEVVEFLNDYMTRMVNCVNETGGVVDKYIGDAIMAVWGAPVSTGNDTENAINASLAMRSELMKFNQGRGGDKKPIIKIGCGINTGPVLAGQIGSEERMEYTVIGDPVNLASRIETLNKPFGTDILISEDSFQLVKGLYRAVPMQKITVKGKKAPQQIYAVLGRLDDPSAPQTIEELRMILGTKEQPFRRRRDDQLEEEVKYEIHEG